METSDPADLYIDLLKECLLGRIYGPELLHLPETPEDPGMREAIDELASVGISVTRPRTVSDEVYEVGRNHTTVNPTRSATLVGRARLDNLHDCVERAIRDGIPGDLIETGVWRGGLPILMRAIVKARGEDRLVWVADSFAGLPDIDLAAYPLDREFAEHQKLDVDWTGIYWRKGSP